MADNVTVTNTKTSFDADTNPDYPVRTTEKSAKQVQHFVLDGGGTGAESIIDVGQEAMVASLPVVLASNQSAIPITDNSGSLTVDGTVAVTQATASSLNAQVVGDVAHDGADGGNPVKIGGKAYDLIPASSGTTPGPSAVAANDRANLYTDLQGRLITGCAQVFTTLTAINTTYDDSPTTATSANISCYNYRVATIGGTFAMANTPTDITIAVEISLDGTNYFQYRYGPLGSWIYDDLWVGAGNTASITFPIACQTIRVVVTATGTDASNTFTLSNFAIYLRT